MPVIFEALLCLWTGVCASKPGLMIDELAQTVWLI